MTTETTRRAAQQNRTGDNSHSKGVRTVHADLDEVVDWVVRYAQAGMKVVPLHAITADGGCSCGHADCPSPGKHPRLRPAHDRDDPARNSCRGECGALGHGVWDATSELGQVAEWLAAWPHTNWGIVPPDGVVVLDIDPRSGGHQSLAALQARYGRLPATLTARTGGDGWHVWLRHPGVSRGKLADGIDVKKHGGYVVVPPATHASGGRYEWTQLVRIAPAPRWVSDLLAPPAPTTPAPVIAPGSDRQTALERLVRVVERAREGERNRCLFWAACRASEEGLDTTALLDAAQRKGLSPAEATATIASATRTTGSSGASAGAA